VEDSELKLCVKNTFLDVEEPLAVDLPLRAKSQPNLTIVISDNLEFVEQEPLSPLSSVAPDSPKEAPKVAPDWLVGLPEVSFSTEELLVKNTFLTLDEPVEPCLLTRTKSVPHMFKLKEDGAWTSDASTVATSLSFQDSESSDGSPKSVNLDFVSSVVNLPMGYLAPFDLQDATVVPCCAIQQVDPLEEVPLGLDIMECAFAVPAAKKVLIKPGSLATQGKVPRATRA